MIKTKLCDVLGIDYPIVQAPMGWITWAEIAAAVSNAGALGTIGPNAGVTMVTEDSVQVGENLRAQIRQAHRLTSKPFAVNFPIGVKWDRVYSDQCIKVAIEEKIPVAITSMGDPAIYTRLLHDAGVKVIHVVTNVKQALGAERAGVDAVATTGFEGGGGSGFAELTTFVLVPQVADAVKIPVIAGGGIADSRGFVAARALGASGVYMGTRFMATRECKAHQNVKDAIVKAGDVDTISWGRKTGIIRTLRTNVAKTFMEKELGGATREELLGYLGMGRFRSGFVDGDMENGQISCGAVAGMIKEIMSCAEVVQSIVQGTDQVLARLK